MFDKKTDFKKTDFSKWDEGINMIRERSRQLASAPAQRPTKWIDSRIASPSCNHFASYIVVFKTGPCIRVGFADWMPDDGYKSGKWQNARCTNGNPLGGEVLFWMPHPQMPDIAQGVW